MTQVIDALDDLGAEAVREGADNGDRIYKVYRRYGLQPPAFG